MTAPRKTIVAGVGELSPHDLSMRVALELGRRSGATVHLVHAFDVQPLAWTVPGAGQGWAEAWTELPRQLGTALREIAVPLCAGRPPVCHALPGGAARVIRGVAEEHHADLVIVGAAHAPHRPAFLGTTAARVVRASPVPVLVVRTPLPPAAPRVLVATDLSAVSADLYERGLDTVAAFLGQGLPAVRAVVVAAAGALEAPLPVATPVDAWLAALRRFVADRRARSVAVETVARAGAPVREISAEAAEWRADLLVVGTHARRGLDRLILGSTAEACIRDAPCSVLAVPPALRGAHLAATAAAARA
ncbi:MAG TPA: universal stress protein, partial [Longimicrobiaceae bacterium]|nr:universal stress protein [Longimicrobiaceae bacterium]